MTKHKQAADYHRGEAQKHFDEQGRTGSNYTHHRFEQMNHQRAARDADSRHAEATGQEVVYTPIGTPVFRSK